MPNFTVLKAKLTEFVGGETDLQIRDSLNAKVIPAKKIIDTVEVNRYLFNNGLWLEIKTANTTYAQMMVDALTKFQYFDLSDAANLASVTTVLDGLIADTQVPSFTAESGHKTAILAMADTNISWSDQNWDGSVTLPDIEYARTI